MRLKIRRGQIARVNGAATFLLHEWVARFWVNELHNLSFLSTKISANSWEKIILLPISYVRIQRGCAVTFFAVTYSFIICRKMMIQDLGNLMSFQPHKIFLPNDCEVICCSRDELPQLLLLPQTLREVDSRQSLTSLALLGKGLIIFINFVWWCCVNTTASVNQVTH